MNRSALLFVGFAILVCFGFHAIWTTDQPWREYRIASTVVASVLVYAVVWLTGRKARERDSLALIDRVTPVFAHRKRLFVVALALLGGVLLALTAKFVLDAFPDRSCDAGVCPS